MKITLVGMGMGTPSTLTGEALEALTRADAVVGAERLLAALPGDIAATRAAASLPEKIAALLDAHPEWREVAVALSGDVGFYSGARRLLELLGDRVGAVLPGLSTPQYFAARLRRPWQDFRLASLHGARPDILAEVLNHPAVLFLTDGESGPAAIARELVDAGLGGARVTVGENLGAENERVVAGMAAEFADGRAFAQLCVALVENRETFAREAVPGIPDAEFIRGRAPMTKREVRALIPSLLSLRQNDVIHDVGAGTGSVAVELALMARRGRVYAIENDADAFALIRENREKFGVRNLVPIAGTAPDALDALPAPDAVFVGGSKGRMRDILSACVRRNPGVRLAISAVALETLSTATDALRELGVKNVSITQIAASRAVARGRFHMMEAQNPVFLIAGGGA